MAIEREWTLLAGTAHLGIRSDRRDHLPYGLCGGKSATGSLNLLRQRDGEKTLNVMVSSTIHEGETLYHRQAGGGGFGLPAQREPLAVAEDVRSERVSRRAAREEYGVVLVEGSFEVDLRQTEKLRSDPQNL